MSFGEGKYNAVVHKNQNRGERTKKYFFEMSDESFDFYAHFIGNK